jgi:tetratricopeptide (TPR) repeat protein
MLGQCALALGRPGDAVAQLEQALALPDLTRQQGLALRFELGRAFEGVGDLERAREAWEAVAELDPLFCDVELHLVRLEELRKSPAPAHGAAAAAAGDFESFEDVIAEAAADEIAEPEAEPESEPEPESRAETEPEPAAPSAPDPGPGPAPPTRRRKRISFV